MGKTFEPPERIERADIVGASDDVMAMPDIPFSETETIFRINVADMDWDIGVMIYEPAEAERVPTGADGRKVGVFLIHGGASDWRSVEPLARLLVAKLGYRVASMTYPGRLYLPDPSRDWPGNTIHLEGWRVYRGRRIRGDPRRIDARTPWNTSKCPCQAWDQLLPPDGGMAACIRGSDEGSLPPLLRRR